MKTFIIAEAGVNHNGSDSLALELVETAARCGADAVKFQTFTAEKLVRPGAEKAEYQKRATGDGDQFEMLKKLEMSEELHRKLMRRCEEMGIEFMSTPFDEQAADFLVALGMKRIKVPSGEITNFPFLEYLAAKNVPMIVSTGMATLQEVRDAVDLVRRQRERLGLSGALENHLTVLHCTSNYPAVADDVNLRAMHTMAAMIGMPIGYSDHTAGTEVSVAAVALGATVIEKHFTLDKNLPGPDHKASLEPDELRLMIRQIRCIERALGSDRKEPTLNELPVRAVVRRSVTTLVAIKKGQALSADNLALLRPGTGIEPRELPAVVGKRAVRDIAAGTTLNWSDLE